MNDKNMNHTVYKVTIEVDKVFNPIVRYNVFLFNAKICVGEETVYLKNTSLEEISETLENSIMYGIPLKEGC